MERVPSRPRLFYTWHFTKSLKSHKGGDGKKKVAAGCQLIETQNCYQSTACLSCPSSSIHTSLPLYLPYLSSCPPFEPDSIPRLLLVISRLSGLISCPSTRELIPGQPVCLRCLRSLRSSSSTSSLPHLNPCNLITGLATFSVYLSSALSQGIDWALQFLFRSQNTLPCFSSGHYFKSRKSRRFRLW